MPISVCNITTDSSGQELALHGSVAFPIACYRDDLQEAHVPWHWHEELEAILVSEGTLLLGCGNSQYTVRAGEGFLVNSGVLHGCWNGGSCRIHSLVFHPRLVGGAADSIYQAHLQPILDRQAAGSIHLRPAVPWQQEILQCMETAWQLVSKAGKGHEFPVRQQLTQILWLLSSNFGAASPAPDSAALRSAQRIKVMLQFIHDHYSQHLTLAQIAASAAVSQSECLRCFRCNIRLSPIVYLRQYRVRQAARMLRESDEKISVIAHACGFEDMSFFAKTFRNVMGVCPSDFRQHR